jgi:ubiquitin-protein ligase
MPPDGRKPLFHPNVYADGKICLSLLKTKEQGGGWTPSHTIKMVLIAIQKLLDEPNNADAAQHEAHKIFKSNPEEYKRRVRAQMQLPGIKDSAAATGGA